MMLFKFAAALAFSGSALFCAQANSMPGEASRNYLDVGKAKLYYEQCGSAGPSLVLLHDGLLHSTTWDDVWTPLCGKYRVLRYDRRGYGRSTAATAPFVPEDDLYQLMRSVKMDRAILVGNSSGAGLALDFTLAHPEMVEGLMLIGPVVHGMPSSAYFVERGSKNSAPLNQNDVTAAAGNWSKDRFLISGGRAEARKKLYDALVQNPQNLKTGGQFEIRPSPPAVLRLSQIQAPALLIVGDADIADVIAYAGAIEAALPIVWFEVWKDTGHLVQLERPDELVARLNTFVLLAERKEVSLPPATLQTFAGDYQFFQRTITLSVNGNRLALRLPDMPDKPLFAASESRFFVRTTGTELEFEKDASGRVTQLIIHNTDGNVIKCPRL
jgi:pimeloyl-ACP methyl ester carboxylesterase